MHTKRVARLSLTLAVVMLAAGLIAGQRPASAARAGAAGTPTFLPIVLRHFPLPAYSLQNGSPVYLANFLNNLGCSWFGFAGRAFDLDSQAVIGLVVQVRAGGAALPTVQTGSTPEIGPGGYGVYLADHPSATTDYYTIQLFSDADTALSEQYPIPTFADCTRNLVMINFVQNS
ncbi:MAG: hypothetical protein IT317_22600 [Anaerolineales bacterium]|nr:hypothetical protein [Anaerolineales bacterium]